MKGMDRAFELEPAIARVGAFVRDCRCFPGLEADRDSLLAVVQQVEQLHANLGTPLRILLVGGTGVGKSSLLNAIAGAEIAQVSHRRPTTQRLTAYFHKDAGTAALGALESEAVLRPHERETMREKIVVDAPDFDSSVLENHENLFKALEVADLVVCVVTPEKYMSRELFGVLTRYRHGRRFVHAMNKADLGVDAAVLEDFRRGLAEAELPSDRVFHLSARAAYEDQVQGRAHGTEAGDFPALMGLIERELDRVRIREIKSHNLVERVDRLLARVARHVPADAAQRLDAWHATAQAALRDLSRDVGARFTETLFATPELRNVAAYYYGTGFGFLFGAFLRIAQRLRATLRSGLAQGIPSDLEDVKTLVHDRLARTDPGVVVEQLRLLLAAFVEAGVEHGFARVHVEPHVPREVSPEEVREVYREVESDWAASFSAAFDEMASARDGAVEIQNLGFNVLPGAFTAWVVYKVAAQFVAGVPLGMDYLISALILLTALCWVQWRFAEGLIGRSIDRTFARLTEQLLRKVEARFDDRFLAGARRAIDEARRAVDEVAAMRRSFDGIAGACAEPAAPAALPPLPALEPAAAEARPEAGRVAAD